MKSVTLGFTSDNIMNNVMLLLLCNHFFFEKFDTSKLHIKTSMVNIALVSERERERERERGGGKGVPME